MDSTSHRASTDFSSQRPQSLLFEASEQQHLSSSSASQTPNHTSPHVNSFASVSLPHLGHFERWSESLRDLSKNGWVGHTGSLRAQDTANDKESFDEKAYLSTDTENEARRDARLRRRGDKKRRRKTEIYVSFLFLPAARHKLNKTDRLHAIFRHSCLARRSF